MKFTDNLKNRILSEEYTPTWLGFLFNPFHVVRKGVADEIKILGQQIVGRTLDVGCGGKPYEAYCRSSEYIGIEIDCTASRQNSKADVFYNGNRLPFFDMEFDSVISSQVLEHVFDAKKFLSEINRVLKENGILLMTVPFVWDEHEKPNDFVRYSSFGMKKFLEEQGFEVLIFNKSISDFRVFSQLFCVYAHKYLSVKNKNYLNLMLAPFWVFPINLVGSLLAQLLPSNEDLFLNSVVLARKAKNRI